MNHWLQTKLYDCPRCDASYVHDRAYHHALFLCLHREGAQQRNHQPSAINQEDDHVTQASRPS